MDKYIKYLPLALFSAYAIKVMVNGADLPDAAVLSILAAISGYYEFQKKSKFESEVNNKLLKFSEQLTELEKSNTDLKTHVSGIKLAQNFRSNTINKV